MTLGDDMESSDRTGPFLMDSVHAHTLRFERPLAPSFENGAGVRKATREYAAHYHRERNHQGLDNRLVEPDERVNSTCGAIECVPRLGGMLRFYQRAAA